MNARPIGVLGTGRALRVEPAANAWTGPVVLLGFALGVVALFALMLTVIVDTAQQVPPARVIESTFASRTDSAAPYAPRTELRVKPQRR